MCEQAKRITSYLQKKALYKRVNELCKKLSLCPNCGATNGVVKRLPPLKIVHERFRNVKKGDPVLTEYFGECVCVWFWVFVCFYIYIYIYIFFSCVFIYLFIYFFSCVYVCVVFVPSLTPFLSFLPPHSQVRHSAGVQ